MERTRAGRSAGIPAGVTFWNCVIEAPLVGTRLGWNGALPNNKNAPSENSEEALEGN